MVPSTLSEYEAVERYLMAKQLINACGFGVALSEGGAFLVVPPKGTASDAVWETTNISELAIYSIGLSEGWHYAKAEAADKPNSE